MQLKILLLLIFSFFLFSTNAQIQIGQDIDGEGLFDNSGGAVDTNASGSRVAIGAVNNSSSSGHVRVYDFDEENWIQIGDDIDGGINFGRFGAAVVLNDQGDRLVASGIGFNKQGVSGFVRIFDLEGENWIQLGADITYPNDDDEGFGEGLTLNNNGTRLAIGHPNSDVNGINSGSVIVYDIIDSDFIQVGEEIPGEEIINGAGRSISLSGSGNTLAIGALANNNDNGADSGHVRVFNYDGDGASWNQVGQDIDGEAAVDFSGAFVSISDDGTRVAIGATSNDDAGNNAGHVRVFDFIGDDWVKVGIDIDGEANGNASGAAVNFSNDGNILFIGAPGNDDTDTDSGHVRAYNTSNLLNVENFDLNDINIYPNPTKGVVSFETNLISLFNLTLYDITGKMIKKYTDFSDNQTIDISYLVSGVYFIEINSNDNNIIKRVIKY